MTVSFKGALKLFVTKVGAHLTLPALSRLSSLLNYLYTGRWMVDHGFVPRLQVDSRTEVIAAVAQPIADQEVLYLEFGVWKGESMNQWSCLLRNKESRLHGFDSFEGLPEAVDHHGASGVAFAKGDLSTQGELPATSDPRVRFFKGWFEDTLPSYEFVDSPVLVVFLDADLYSSTKCVLTMLKKHIKIGAILYFDEFWERYHEQRAFEEFLADTGMKFDLIAADYGMRHVAFRRIL
jgi:hypothetical protein